MTSFCQVYYNYWDEFVKEWKKFPNKGTNLSGSTNTNISDWTYPLFNNDGTLLKKGGLTNPTIEFLPEPWWGNAGNDILHSVVINFNPGKGGKIQLANATTTQSVTSYRKFISERVSEFQYNSTAKMDFWGTSYWHFQNRALPIFTLLNDVKWYEKLLPNHLSIELIPWHSAHFTEDVLKYTQQNISCIINHSIGFAAEASRHIANNVLRNVVIFICSMTKLLQIFADNKDYEVVDILEKQGQYENAKVATFHIKDSKSILFKDITFIAIWQPRQTSMNNFPYSADMKRVFDFK